MDLAPTLDGLRRRPGLLLVCVGAMAAVVGLIVLVVLLLLPREPRHTLRVEGIGLEESVTLSAAGGVEVAPDSDESKGKEGERTRTLVWRKVPAGTYHLARAQGGWVGVGQDILLDGGGRTDLTVEPLTPQGTHSWSVAAETSMEVVEGVTARVRRIEGGIPVEVVLSEPVEITVRVGPHDDPWAEACEAFLEAVDPHHPLLTGLQSSPHRVRLTEVRSYPLAKGHPLEEQFQGRALRRALAAEPAWVEKVFVQEVDVADWGEWVPVLGSSVGLLASPGAGSTGGTQHFRIRLARTAGFGGRLETGSDLADLAQDPAGRQQLWESLREGFDHPDAVLDADPGRQVLVPVRQGTDDPGLVLAREVFVNEGLRTRVLYLAESDRRELRRASPTWSAGRSRKRGRDRAPALSIQVPMPGEGNVRQPVEVTVPIRDGELVELENSPREDRRPVAWIASPDPAISGTQRVMLDEVSAGSHDPRTAVLYWTERYWDALWPVIEPVWGEEAWFDEEIRGARLEVRFADEAEADACEVFVDTLRDRLVFGPCPDLSPAERADQVFHEWSHWLASRIDPGWGALPSDATACETGGIQEGLADALTILLLRSLDGTGGEGFTPAPLAVGGRPYDRTHSYAVMGSKPCCVDGGEPPDCHDAHGAGQVLASVLLQWSTSLPPELAGAREPRWEGAVDGILRAMQSPPSTLGDLLFQLLVRLYPEHPLDRLQQPYVRTLVAASHDEFHGLPLVDLASFPLRLDGNPGGIVYLPPAEGSRQLGELHVTLDPADLYGQEEAWTTDAFLAGFQQTLELTLNGPAGSGEEPREVRLRGSDAVTFSSELNDGTLVFLADMDGLAGRVPKPFPYGEVVLREWSLTDTVGSAGPDLLRELSMRTPGEVMSYSIVDQFDPRLARINAEGGGLGAMAVQATDTGTCFGEDVFEVHCSAALMRPQIQVACGLTGETFPGADNPCIKDATLEPADAIHLKRYAATITATDVWGRDVTKTYEEIIDETLPRVAFYKKNGERLGESPHHKEVGKKLVIQATDDTTCFEEGKGVQVKCYAEKEGAQFWEKDDWEFECPYEEEFPVPSDPCNRKLIVELSGKKIYKKGFERYRVDVVVEDRATNRREEDLHMPRGCRCGCQQGGGPAAGPLMLGVLALALIVLRRSRDRGPGTRQRR